MLNKLTSFIKSHYIPDATYGWLYAYGFVFSVSQSMMSVFTAPWLLAAGYSVSSVLLHYALFFGVMGSFAPLGTFLLRKYGHLTAFILSQICQTLFFVLLSMAHGQGYLTYLALLCSGLAGGLINPWMDILQALYVDDSRRGRQMSAFTVSCTVGGLVGTLLAACLLVPGTYWPIGVAGVIFNILSVFVISFLPDRVRLDSETSHFKPIADQLKRAVLHPHQHSSLAFMGEQFVIISRVIFVPAFIFMAVGNFKTFGVLVALALVFEVSIQAILGHAIDKKGFLSRFINIYGIYVLSMGYILTQVSGPISSFIAATVTRLSSKMFDVRFVTMMHSRISHLVHKDILLFGVVWQTSLCFWEFVWLGLFAWLAWWLELQSFSLFIVFASVGAILAMSPLWGKKKSC